MSLDVPQAATVARACPQCGAVGAARYCGDCGHLLALESPATDLRALVREGAGEVIGLDRRLGATLRDLLAHPARIVAAHVNGRTAGYVEPLRLFLFLGGLYLLALRWLQPFRFETVLADAAAPLSITRMVFGSAEGLQRALAEHGLTLASAGQRFQERANALIPLVTALALVPLAGVLELLHRRRTWREHFAFLLVTSNAIWLISLLVLPIAAVRPNAGLLGLYLGKYTYCAIGFVTTYGGSSRLRTGLRFGAFAISEFVITTIVSILLSSAILASVLYP